MFKLNKINARIFKCRCRVNPISISDTAISYTFENKIGNLRFSGIAVDDYFGQIQTWNFNDDRFLNLYSNQGSLIYVIKENFKDYINYIGFPLPHSEYPKEYYIHFYGNKDTIRVDIDMPYPWIYIDDYYYIPGEAIIKEEPLPVLLIHGWKPTSDPPPWSTLIPLLKNKGIDHYEFTYSGLGEPRKHAIDLKIWIEKIRDLTKYKGKFDIICHSMGALVTRWYMDKLDGAKNIRQWIGIAPVNHGSAIANLEWLIPNILGYFFNGLTGTNPAETQMKTYSSTVLELNKKEINPDILYRNIVGINSSKEGKFNIFLNGKTRVENVDYNTGKNYCYYTYWGDGVVALSQSKLEGAGIDIFDDLNHNSLLHDSKVLNRIISYLENIELPSLNNLPDKPDPENDHYATGKGNQGIIYKNNICIAINKNQIIEFIIDSSIKEASILLTWLMEECELNLKLISPSGIEMNKSTYPIIEFCEGKNSIWYVIDKPEIGNWKAQLNALKIPKDGLKYTFLTFYESLIEIEPNTKRLKYVYNTSDSITITAFLNDDIRITGADVYAEVMQPDEGIYNIVLNDNANNGDSLADDGIYSNKIYTEQAGYYYLTFFAKGIIENETFERMEFLTLEILKDSLTIIKNKEEKNNYTLNYNLFQNYPNPFNTKTKICFELFTKANIKICIYNINGRLIKTLINEEKAAGYHSVIWDGKDENNKFVASGIYFYVLKDNNNITIEKHMLYLK